MKMTLTDKVAAQAAPVPGKQIEIWDSVMDGLYLRISPAGTKTWMVRFYQDGEKKREPIGRFPEVRTAIARDKARNRVIDQQLPTPIPTRSGMSFSALCDAFMAKRERDLSQKTISDWKRIIAVELDGKLGPIDPNDSAAFRATTRSILESIENRGAVVMRNRTLTVISAIFNWAIAEDKITPASTLVGVNKLSEFPRERYLSDEEIAKVLPLAMRDQPEWRAFWILLFYTAARRGAILGSRWEQFDLKEKIWSIPSKLIKGKKTEIRYTIVPLTATPIRFLTVAKEITGHTPYVIANLETELQMTNPQKAFNRMNKKAALSLPWTRHDIRHTVSTNLGRLGTDEHIIDRIMHHRTGSSNIHRRYNQWQYFEEKKTALEKWADLLDSLAA